MKPRASQQTAVRTGRDRFPAKFVPSGRRIGPRSVVGVAVLAFVALSFSGCTTLSDYIHNGFQVGPNYHKPPGARGHGLD